MLSAAGPRTQGAPTERNARKCFKLHCRKHKNVLVRRSSRCACSASCTAWQAHQPACCRRLRVAAHLEQLRRKSVQVLLPQRCQLASWHGCHLEVESPHSSLCHRAPLQLYIVSSSKFGHDEVSSSVAIFKTCVLTCACMSFTGALGRIVNTKPSASCSSSASSACGTPHAAGHHPPANRTVCSAGTWRLCS